MTEQPRPTDDLTRYVLVLLAITLTCTGLYFGRDLLILLFTSAIFAALMLPLHNGLVKRRFPSWLAAFLCCLSMLVIVVSLIWFFAWQYSHFAKDLPELRTSLDIKLTTIRSYLDGRFHFSRQEQEAWMDAQVKKVGESGGSIVMGVFSATGAVLAVVMLIPIFTFFLLLLKGKVHTFLEQLSGDEQGATLKVVKRSSLLSRKYLRGVVTVMIILTVLNSIGFLLLGLKYAILLAATAALLNVVPYIGPWIGSLLPMFIALITKDSMWYAVGALGVILISQFLDNNFITPKIVGSSVSINPLASIVALLAGGMLWGVAGLILAIPFTGVLKAVCDEVPALRPWGFLLGEERTWPEEDLIDIPLIRKKGLRTKTPN